MANIRKRAASRYEAAIYLRGVRKSKTFPTKRAAELWAAETERAILAGELRGGSHTFTDLMRRYADEVSPTKRGERWEQIRLRMFEGFDIARVRLTDLKREHVEAFIEQRKGNVSGSSINRELNLIGHVIRQGRRWRWLNSDPMADIQRPKNPPPRDRRITDDEIAAILRALQYDERDTVELKKQLVGLAFLFALETAMRAGEIAALEWSCVHLDKRFCELPKTKNGSARNVPLSTEAVRLLERVEWRSGPVFRVSSGVISTLFRRAVLQAKIPDLTFHDSRHEAITRLAKKLDVLDLARMVGHKELGQLMTYYNATATELAGRLG